MEIRNWCGFQYNFCYCSIIGGSEEYNNIYNVSIQLLLLFYIIKHDKHVVSNGFNTTFVTVLLESSMKILICTVQFQYNFCYCSMVNDSIRGHYNVAFQYNFCYCSINCIILVTSYIVVSIQLLLLFYVNGYVWEGGWDGVSIQLLLLFYLWCGCRAT